ncbi:hypothetical protein B0H12DRAFT_649850 [Mycena haematopus]|nr:hypothetical protein B0H12DRAFT_649850 [Mycena haematopus]
MPSTICPDFQPMKASGMKSKGGALQGTLEINLGSPFRILLAADSGLETPSPLTLCFDFPKPPSSPLGITTEWTDSDSDSEAQFQPAFFNDPQYIIISPDSPLYSPHPPPTFQTTFEIPRVPFPSKPLLDGDYSESAVAFFRAELEHILPSQAKKDLFLVDEAALRGMDEELFAAPLDEFMAACLALLQLAPSTRPPPPNSSESNDTSPPFPRYYLASFLDLDRPDASPLDPSLRELFRKRTLLTSRSQASPAAKRETIPFL